MNYSRTKKKGSEKILRCYHCGDACLTEICFDEHVFCCEGCKTIYDLLRENNLCTYYHLSAQPGINQKGSSRNRMFDYLDEEEVTEKLLVFRNETEAHVKFQVPEIHCSSCIWLLENLHRLNPAITSSRVDFLAREVYIVYQRGSIRLSQVAALMNEIGYPPAVSLNDLEIKKQKKDLQQQVIKIGIAGFCFGNIMMMSFPEYFSSGNFYDHGNLKYLFNFLNLALSLPVLLYCASDFFVSGWKALRHGHLNIDAPIALAILVTFTRSLYEILTFSGPGYLDSMTGIVFFMLLGRYFQNRTYASLAFDRDYKSYFPVGVILVKQGKETNVPVSQLREGDRIRIRNNELVPADSVLVSEKTHIDYSFLTGESEPVRKGKGDLVYAGARQVDGAVEMEVMKPASQSYLTQLWNKDEKSARNERNKQTFTDRINRYFTIAVLFIAATSALVWMFIDASKALNAFTAVLIVACPCGLLLTSTFANGNLLRIFGRNKFYLKNSSVIEQMANCDTIVFDKTGTLTNGMEVQYQGTALDETEQQMVCSLAAQSTHPLSVRIREYFSGSQQVHLSWFREQTGRGIVGTFGNIELRLGDELFATGTMTHSDHQSTKVYLGIDHVHRGTFLFAPKYRPGLKQVLDQLSASHELKVLSGDHHAAKESLQELFGTSATLLFNQQPGDKKEQIKKAQARGHRVMMIGDGLNDAVALLQSDTGIAISDNTSGFSPACDAILHGDSLPLLNKFISLARAGRRLIMATFVFSLIYNMAGLFFAVQGTLSPVIAAILMPASTVTIVLLTTSLTALAARRYKL